LSFTCIEKSELKKRGSPSRDRHRRLAEDVHAHACRALGVLAMHVVGKRDVDGVDLGLFQALLELVVSEQVRDAVLAAELAELLRIVGGERRQLRAAPGVGEGRQHRDL
jgi:hypothetical protein